MMNGLQQVFRPAQRRLILINIGFSTPGKTTLAILRVVPSVCSMLFRLSVVFVVCLSLLSLLIALVEDTPS